MITVKGTKHLKRTSSKGLIKDRVYSKNKKTEIIEKCPYTESDPSVLMEGWDGGPRILTKNSDSLYTYGDEQLVRIEDSNDGIIGGWKYLNLYGGIIAISTTSSKYPWNANWPEGFSATKNCPMPLNAPVLNQALLVPEYLTNIGLELNFDSINSIGCDLESIQFKIKVNDGEYSGWSNFEDYNGSEGWGFIPDAGQYGDTFYVKISANNCLGRSQESNEIIYTAPFQLPAAPSFALESASRTEVFITNMNGYEDYFTGGCGVSFYYSMKIDNGNWGEWIGVGREDNLYLYLEVNHSYTIKFKAVNCVGESVSEDQINFALNYSLPQAPNIYIADEGPDYLDIGIGAWDELDNGGCAANYSYTVSRDNGLTWDDYSTISSLEEGFVVQEEFILGAVYKIKVRAVNCLQEDVYSNTLEFSTTSPQPYFEDFNPELDFRISHLNFTSSGGIINPYPAQYPLYNMQVRINPVDKNYDEDGNFTGYDQPFWENDPFELGTEGEEPIYDYPIPFESITPYTPNQSYAVQFKIINDVGSAFSDIFHITSPEINTNGPTINTFDFCGDMIITLPSNLKVDGASNGGSNYINVEFLITNNIGQSVSSSIQIENPQPNQVINLRNIGTYNRSILINRTSTIKARISNYKNLAWSPYGNTVSAYMPQDC